MELFRIFGVVDVDDKASKQLDDIDGKGKKTESKLGGTAKKIGKAGAIVGGAMAGIGTAAFAMTEKVTGAFDDISKGAQRLGISTDAYQELDFWASQNGLSHDRMEKAVGRFNQRLGQATNGNDKYASALEQMGVNLDDVRDGTLSTEDAFAQSIQKLSEMESQQDQVNLATEMFGTRLARDMLPALQDGALSMDDAKKKAEELGLVIGEDALDAGVKFQDTWDQLKRSMTTASQQIIGQMMPAFQGIMDWVIEHMPQIQSVISTVFDVISTIFSTAITWVQTLIGWFQTWFTSNEETMNGIWQTIQTVFTNVLTFLQETWALIKQYWEEHGQAILDNAIMVFESIWATIETVFNAVKDIIEQVIGYIVPWVQEKLTVLQEFWEENGAQIMEAVQNAFAIIQGIIQTVMPIIQKIIKNAWSIIQSVFDTVIGVIMGLVKTFSSLLTGDFEGIKEGLTRIWESLWQGIKGVVRGAWNLLSGVFGDLRGNISGWFTDLKDSAVNWGKDLLRGFWEGVKGMGSWLGDKVGGLVSKVVPGPIKKVLGIASPSKLMKEYGEDTGEGLALGMEAQESRIGKASSLMANAVKEPINIGTRQISQQAQSQAPTLSLGNLESKLDALIKAVLETKDVYIDGEKATDIYNNINAVNATVGGYMD